MENTLKEREQCRGDSKGEKKTALSSSVSKYFHESLTEKSNTLKAVIACLTTHVSKTDMVLAKIQSVGKKHSLFPLPPPSLSVQILL